ncbi:MAG: sigma-54-dependent Fis family transcriptional regulator [Candidatus Latescibacteria bacterium]|nr:sigma-54-dependent Fis family transcriptional regulator [Candidatus Latescibacterota bacterium]
MPEETAGGSILIVDDEKGVRDSLQLVLEYEGYRIMKASTGQEGLDKVEDGELDVILLDVKMPGLDGLEVLERLRPAETGRVVVMISGHADIATAVEATRMGAFDFLEKPLDQEKVLLTVRNAMSKAQLERQNRLLRREVEEHYMLVAQSAVMQEVLSQMERVAATDARVLITGENGTGKELIARRLHGFSGRAGGPFVPVNCAAIPRDLIESELFGHVKGAFTGAQSNKVGKFELASGGTLFLDEVGDMSLSAQAKVLRALEEGVVERVGGSTPIRIDVRVIAATNMDLEAQIEAGQFRKDLYYRLRVVPLPIPPLRERPEDIGPLCDHFLAYYAAMDKRSPRVLSSDARLRFQEYPWPGNVRELRNAMERLVIMSEGETITVTDVDAILLDRGAGAQGGLEDLAHLLRDVPDLGSFRDETEKLYLLKVLQDNNWNVSAAARVMGIQRSNLYRKLEKHGIERGDTLEPSAGSEER